MTRRQRIGIAVAVGIAQFAVGHAEARPRHHHRHHHHHRIHHHRHHVALERGTVVGGRPAGCPRQFCACGIRKFLGIQDSALDLAANWPRKYQRTQPAPYTVAARPGHAFLLLSHIAGDVWNVHDWNSGGHLTRIHPRSIAGYTIVDPKAPRMAMVGE